ncbi:hypothetical protein BGZ73_008058, partial [Actinomortierella ambigua]
MNTHSSPQPIPTSRSNTTASSNNSNHSLNSGLPFHQRQQQLHPHHHNHHNHHHHHHHQDPRPPLVKRSHSHSGYLDSDRTSPLLISGSRRPLNLLDDYLGDSPVEEEASDDGDAASDSDGPAGFRRQHIVRIEDNHQQHQRQRQQQQRHSLQTYPGHPLHPSQHAPAYLSSDESAFMLGSSSPKPRSFLTSTPPHRRSFQGMHDRRKGHQEVEEEEEVEMVAEGKEGREEEQGDSDRLGEAHAHSSNDHPKEAEEENAGPVVEKQVVDKSPSGQERGALQQSENGQRGGGGGGGGGGAYATTGVAAATATSTVTTPELLHLPPSPPPSATTPVIDGTTRQVTRESGQHQQQQPLEHDLQQQHQQEQRVQVQQQHQQQQQQQHEQLVEQHHFSAQQESHAMTEDRRKSPVTHVSASGTNDAVGEDDSLSCLGSVQTNAARGASEGAVGTPTSTLTPTPLLRANRGMPHPHHYPSITIDTSSECLRRPFSNGTSTSSSTNTTQTNTNTNTNTNTSSSNNSNCTTTTSSSNNTLREAFKAGREASMATTTTTSYGNKQNNLASTQPNARSEGHLTLSFLQQKQQQDHPSASRPLTSAFSSSSSSAFKNSASSLPPAPPVSASASLSASQHLKALSEGTQNVLLPSLSPTSPRTANPALVNSLDQLSLSWRAPEQTPTFPINRLHRSRTLSS